MARHDADIERLLDHGMSSEQIAAELEIHPATVSRRRAALGRSARNTHYPPATLARVEQLLNDGWSLLEISKTEHLDYSTLRKRFAGRGWTREQIVEQSKAVRTWHREYRSYNYVATLRELRTAERKVA